MLPLELIIEWHTESRRSVRAVTSRPLGDDALREQLHLNGEESPTSDHTLYRKLRVGLAVLEQACVPDDTIAVLCEFLRVIAEYSFNHRTTPHDARKEWHRAGAGYALTHGAHTLTVTLSRGELVMNFARTRISINRYLTEQQTCQLFECFATHFQIMRTLIEEVARQSPNPNDEAVLEGLRRYEETGHAENAMR